MERTTTLPAYEQATMTPGVGHGFAPRASLSPLWVRKDGAEPPKVGALIRSGRVGTLKVTGYFQKEGYLGLLAVPLAKNIRHSEYSIFGPEYELAEES